jgi:hypothetical protein
VIRTEQRRVATGIQGSSTRVGKPRLRWLEDGENDLRELKERDMEAKVKYKRTATSHKGDKDSKRTQRQGVSKFISPKTLNALVGIFSIFSQNLSLSTAKYSELVSNTIRIET